MIEIKMQKLLIGILTKELNLFGMENAWVTTFLRDKINERQYLRSRIPSSDEQSTLILDKLIESLIMYLESSYIKNVVMYGNDPRVRNCCVEV